MTDPDANTSVQTRATTRRILAPLVLTQFVASFAGSAMNVSISSIAKDINTDVHGVQTAITLFLLCMAALMIPGSKLTDLYGRKRCLRAGLTVYGTGAVIAALAPALGVLIVGYSAFEGVGSALMIPPIYILATVMFDDVRSRARAFGAISGMAGVGAAAGPLIGGLITTGITWRVTFLLQAAIVATVVLLTRRLVDPLPADHSKRFDRLGAVLSAFGMGSIVVAILQVGVNNALVVVFGVAGVALLAWFFLHIRAFERAGREPLLSSAVFRDRVANLALLTQNLQWLLLMGISFVVSVYLQVVRGLSAIETGLVFTSATAGVLASSLLAERFAKRRAQSTLIRAGFLISAIGIGLLLAFARETSSLWAFVPGLLLIGIGAGVMMTPSINVVQSSFPEQLQGEISGLSRSVSNLGSSLGTAIAGTILVSDIGEGNDAYGVALIVLCALALAGLLAGLLIPARPPETQQAASAADPAQPATG